MNNRYTQGIAVLIVILTAACTSSATRQTHQPIDLPKLVVPAHLTHGPILGRLGSNSIGIWARSSYPARMQVRYGTEPDNLDQISDTVETSVVADNTGIVTLSGLATDTQYFYAVLINDRIGNESSGSFKTLPDPAAEQSAGDQFGQTGFSFVATSCARQSRWNSQGLTPYQTMLREHAGNVDFTMHLGDWLYEASRDWPVSKWQAESVPQGSPIPAIVRHVPNLVGVWQNYKTYFDINPYMAEWHRRVPSYFMFDDHEVLNNFTDATVVGTQRRASLFRDPGLQGWMDYLGWSNPKDRDDHIVFGRSNLSSDDDILFDPEADFRDLTVDDETTLHIHWGGPFAGVRYDGSNRKEIENAIEEAGAQDPNAGVYQVVEVVDKHRLRIFPPPKAQSNSGYSIGIRHYYKFNVANSEFFVIDTRSHRKMGDVARQQKPEMLGRIQMAWLQDAMRHSEADILFVVSPVSFSLPHLESETPPVNDSSWTGFVDERDELLEFWKLLNKTVILVTGDMHDAFSIRWNDHLWEFGAGPIGAFNRESSAKTGWRPASGEFDSAGQLVDIRWSTYFKQGTPKTMRRLPVYAVFQVNSTYSKPLDEHGPVITFPNKVDVQFIDALSGDLLYTESVEIAGE